MGVQEWTNSEKKIDLSGLRRQWRVQKGLLEVKNEENDCTRRCWYKKDGRHPDAFTIRWPAGRSERKRKEEKRRISGSDQRFEMKGEGKSA